MVGACEVAGDNQILYFQIDGIDGLNLFIFQTIRGRLSSANLVFRSAEFYRALPKILSIAP